MSVTTHGPEGYEYQYHASAYLILLHILEYNIQEAYIEKLNSEDLTLQLSDNEIIECQFKKKKSLFQLDSFINCVAKFDPNSAEKNVLHKLLNNELQKFYIITNSRADAFAHQIGVLTEDVSINRYKSTKKKSWPKECFDILNVIYDPPKTDLDNKRNSFLKTQSKDLQKIKDHTSIANKIWIIDSANEDSLNLKINTIFNRLKIPMSSHKLALTDCLECIKTNRANGIDVVYSFKGFIQKYSRNLPSPWMGYLQTGREPELLNLLKTKKILRLTGATFCGKSQMALYIASEFCKEKSGIAYLATTSHSEAENFLLQNTSEDRICILEDPLGQETNQSSVGIYHKIQNLIFHLISRNNKYLILTSNIQTLKGSTNEEDIIHQWNNLTVKDPQKLITFWKLISNFEEQSPTLFNKIVCNVLLLDPPETLFQFGQLDYLFRNKETITQINEVNIRHLANFNVVHIEEKFKLMSTGAINLILILAINSTIIHGLSESDLQYLLDTDDNYLPGINIKDSNLGTTIFNRDPGPEPQLEKYNNTTGFSSSLEDKLEELINKRYIHFINNMFVFTHPIYEQAAKRLLDFSGNPFRMKKVLKIFKKSVGSLNERASVNSINNLFILQKYIASGSNGYETMFEIAEIGLKSTFINTRDAAIQFLSKNVNRLNDKLRNEITEIVRNRYYNPSDFYWDNNIAFIPKKSHWSNNSGMFERMMSRYRGQNKWQEIFQGKEYLKPQEASLALEHLIEKTRTTKSKIDYDIESLIPLMRYNEVFIVEQAAYLIAASLNDENYSTYKEILIDNNPFIQFQLLRGLMRAWPYLNDSTIKKDAFERMENLIGDQFVALQSIDLYTQYGAGYASCSFDWQKEIEDLAIEPMWNLWADLSPLFVNTLPDRLHIHTPRFTSTLLEAKIDKNKIFPLFSAWVTWLERHLLEHQIFDTDISTSILVYFNHVIECLDKSQRFGIIQRLLNIDNTMFCCSLLRILLHRWSKLDVIEQDHIRDKIKSLTPFYHSVILTSDQLPAEIEIDLMGRCFSQLTSCEIIKVLDPEMLMQALVTLYEYPPTADLQYGGYDLWNPILESLLQKPNHMGFKVAFKVFVADTMYPGRFSKFNWPSCKQVQIAVSKNGTEETTSFVFNVLLEDLIENNGSRTGKFWDVFFKSISNDNSLKYGSTLSEYIDAISDYDGNIKCIPSEIFRTYFVPKLKNEEILYQLIKNQDIEGSTLMISKMIHYFVVKKSIILKNMVMTMRDWARKNPDLFEKSELQDVEDYLESYFNTCSKKRKKHRKVLTAEFQKWYLI